MSKSKKKLTPSKETPAARWRSIKSPQPKRDQPTRVQPKKEPKPEKEQAKKEQAKTEQAKKDQPTRVQPKKEPKPEKEQAKKEPRPEKPQKAKSQKTEKTQSPAMKSAMNMKRKKHGGKSKKHGSSNKHADEIDEKKESQPEAKVDGEAAADKQTQSSPKKKKTLKDIGGRNARCKALMRYARAKKAMRQPKGKTFEQGDKNKIPQSLHARVQENPDDEFEKYFRNNCSWAAVLTEEKDENVNSTESTGKRTWVFADTLLNTTCGGNQARYTLMRKQLEREGYNRYHPDMSRDWKGNETYEEKACALQFHALSLDEQTEVDMRNKNQVDCQTLRRRQPEEESTEVTGKDGQPQPDEESKDGQRVRGG